VAALTGGIVKIFRVLSAALLVVTPAVIVAGTTASHAARGLSASASISDAPKYANQCYVTFKASGLPADASTVTFTLSNGLTRSAPVKNGSATIKVLSANDITNNSNELFLKVNLPGDEGYDGTVTNRCKP
jgi:hypothetical protein